MRFSIRLGQSVQADIAGSARIRHPGVAIASFFTKRNSGDATVLGYFDQLNTLFRRVTAAGVTYQTPYMEKVGASATDPDYDQNNLVIPFYYEDFDS